MADPTNVIIGFRITPPSIKNGSGNPAEAPVAPDRLRHRISLIQARKDFYRQANLC
jgi:hypothetical protein